MQVLFWTKKSEAQRSEEYGEIVGQLSDDEIIEWTIEPKVAGMLDRGELVPILRRLVQHGKLSLDDLK